MQDFLYFFKQCLLLLATDKHYRPKKRSISLQRRHWNLWPCRVFREPKTLITLPYRPLLDWNPWGDWWPLCPRAGLAPPWWLCGGIVSKVKSEWRWMYATMNDCKYWVPSTLPLNTKSSSRDPLVPTGVATRKPFQNSPSRPPRPRPRPRPHPYPRPRPLTGFGW